MCYDLQDALDHVLEAVAPLTPLPTGGALSGQKPRGRALDGGVIGKQACVWSVEKQGDGGAVQEGAGGCCGCCCGGWRVGRECVCVKCAFATETGVVGW